MDKRQLPVWHQIGIVALFVGLLTAPSFAQDNTEGNVLPLVFLAIDTSGSMEYEDEVNDLVPSCPEFGPFRRNRWALALEVLTGSFDGFTCSLDTRLLPADREDYAYPIPHVVYEVTQQGQNGLIDLHADVVKFAVATFDTEWGTDPGPLGGWSYGSDRTHPSPLLGVINLGIKNELATSANGSRIQGALRPFFAADAPVTDLRAANLAVEQALLNTIPYGGTPIAPMLTDIHEYLLADSNLATYDPLALTGDPFHACRPRMVILITDGLPTQGEGEEEGYTTSAQAASDLYGSHPLGVKTYVVGYALNAAGVPGELEAIAEAGDPDCVEPPCAFIANNQTELVLALSQILGEILAGRYTRTSAVFTNVTRTPTDSQYQFNTGWGNVPVNTIDRQGFLEQDIYRCTQECRTLQNTAGTCELVSISDAINVQSVPAPVSAIIDTALVPFTRTSPDITPDLLQVPNAGTPANPGEPPVPLMDLTPEGEPGARQILGQNTLGLSDDEDVREAYKEQLIDLFLAAPESRRYGYRTGAIRYGTPAILARPSTGISQRASFSQYQQDNRTRPTVLFAPSALGELMAIRVDRGPEVATSDFGRHLWSVIPNQLLRRVGEHANQTVYLMDLPTVVREILLQRDSATAEPVEEATLWRSVLVQGYRDGGRGYFALDVTNPELPLMLWEIEPERRCWTNDTGGTCQLATTSDASDFCHLGFSYSQPVIGNVFLNTAAFPNQERSVVVFGGGRFDEPDDIPEAYNCGQSGVFNEADIGRRFFVLDMRTGEKLAEFGTGRGNVRGADEGNLLYDFVGHPACFNPGADALLSRCFIGDAGGQIWRVDLSTGDPATWQLGLFYDPYGLGAPLTGSPRAPILSTPALAYDGGTGRMAVIWGTSGGDITLAVGNVHGVFSVSERLTLSSAGQLDAATGVTGSLNWSKIFIDGTMVTGSPLVFDEVAYFTTYRVNPEEACNTDEEAGRLWGLSFQASTTGNPDVPGDPLAALAPDPDQPDARVESIVLGPGFPSGVQIITRPACVGDEALGFDPILGSLGGSGAAEGSTAGALGAAGPGQVELVVQTQPPGGAGTGAAGGGGPAAPKVQTVIQSLQRPRSTIFPLSWALVFD